MGSLALASLGLGATQFSGGLGCWDVFKKQDKTKRWFQGLFTSDTCACTCPTQKTAAISSYSSSVQFSRRDSSFNEFFEFFECCAAEELAPYLLAVPMLMYTFSTCIRLSLCFSDVTGYIYLMTPTTCIWLKNLGLQISRGCCNIECESCVHGKCVYWLQHPANLPDHGSNHKPSTRDGWHSDHSAPNSACNLGKGFVVLQGFNSICATWRFDCSICVNPFLAAPDNDNLSRHHQRLTCVFRNLRTTVTTLVCSSTFFDNAIDAGIRICIIDIQIPSNIGTNSKF